MGACTRIGQLAVLAAVVVTTTCASADVRALSQDELANAIGGCSECCSINAAGMCGTYTSDLPEPPNVCNESKPGICKNPNEGCARKLLIEPLEGDHCIDDDEPDHTCALSTYICYQYQTYFCTQWRIPRGCPCQAVGEPHSVGTVKWCHETDIC
jgi:hypothetical protein